MILIVESLPNEIGGLAKLESLNVSSNHLKVLPQSLNKMTSLREMDASVNQLTAFPTPLCQLKNLDSLNLSHNKITNVPSDVASLTVLELNLNQNRVSLLLYTYSVVFADTLRNIHLFQSFFVALFVSVQLSL